MKVSQKMLSQTMKAEFAYDRVVEVYFVPLQEEGRRGRQSEGLEKDLESLEGPAEGVSVFVAGMVSQQSLFSVPGWLCCALTSSHSILIDSSKMGPFELALPDHSILLGEQGWTLPGREDWLLDSFLVWKKSLLLVLDFSCR